MFYLYALGFLSFSVATPSDFNQKYNFRSQRRRNLQNCQRPAQPVTALVNMFLGNEIGEFEAAKASAAQLVQVASAQYTTDLNVNIEVTSWNPFQHTCSGLSSDLNILRNRKVAGQFNHILTGCPYQGAVGLADILRNGPGQRGSAAVSSGYKIGQNSLANAVTFLHEMGHNFGFEHNPGGWMNASVIRSNIKLDPQRQNEGYCSLNRWVQAGASFIKVGAGGNTNTQTNSTQTKTKSTVQRPPTPTQPNPPTHQNHNPWTNGSNSTQTKTKSTGQRSPTPSQPNPPTHQNHNPWTNGEGHSVDNNWKGQGHSVDLGAKSRWIR